MKILLTGATGFTGSYVLPLLLNEGWDVTCFVRETSDTGSLPLNQIELCYGDLNDQQSLARALEGMDVLVNIASLGFGLAEKIISAVKTANIKRAVYFSTTSIYTTLNPASKSVRMEAERLILESGTPYTIIRPTMIYGSSRDRNLCKFIKFINMSPVFPVFGTGEYNLQPVYVEDLGLAVVSILSTERTLKKAYNLSGGTELTLNEFILRIGEGLDKKVRLLHLPPKPFIKILSFWEKLPLKLPIKSEQIERFNEDKNFSYQEAEEDFGYSPRSFLKGLELELMEMGLIDD
ncbi:MAG: NAD(P)H-binding protein [Deltaproteobacteria bacterium]|nr:NAD(P)H-binding protein [Deltaproteobacteria bacterium]